MTDAFPARERPDVHSRRVPASGAGIRPATGADDAGSRPGSHLAALEPTAPPPAATELTAPEPTAPPVTSEPREPEPTAPLPAARTRDPFLDNARGILIALVVIGHTLESFEVTTETAGGALYTWIYSFHMAAFVAISGYLSRSYRNEPRQVRRLLTVMVVPFLIFQVLHELAKMLLLGHQFELQVVTPAWTLWFLLALLMWRLVTPVLRILRYPLVFTVAIAMITPLDPDLDSTLTLGRFFQMMPFFTLGLATTPQMLRRLKNLPGRVWIGAAVLAAGLSFSVLTHDMFSASRFFLRGSYADGPYETPLAMLMQTLILATGMIGTIALLLMTPRRGTFWTMIGTRSLTIYLLHPLVLLPVRYIEEPFTWIDNWWVPLVLVALGAAITLVLSRGVVVSLTRWLTEPPVGNLLVKTHPDQPQAQRVGT